MIEYETNFIIERVIAGLKGVVARSKKEIDEWATFTNDLRKKMYRAMHGN